jgi:hypothetical protein
MAVKAAWKAEPLGEMLWLKLGSQSAKGAFQLQLQPRATPWVDE